ncbi:MAG: D-alanine--D-alanine ligase [Proteobacteria bacterium]|nr:D-alanine--D-alanine ligase [Pseudomonadota bacterium]
MPLRIGLTYDLRDDYRAMGYSEEETAEFDSVETVDCIDGALRRLGYQTDRIGHVRALAARLVAGETWDLVFNICEGLSGRSREAQVPALLEAYGVPYVFADPLTQAVTLDKAIAKRLVRDAGIATPAFALINSDAEADTCGITYPAFVKPYAEGTGKGCTNASKVGDAVALKAMARQIRTHFNQPALAEAYLPGREFTVGIIGNGANARIVGVMEILLGANAEAEVYSFENKEYCESRVIYVLADDAEAKTAGAAALAAYHALGCRDASRIDFRSDGAGVPHFLEANTIAGLHPSHSDLPMLAEKAGMTYDTLIGEIVAAARVRLGLYPDGAAASLGQRAHG